MSVATAVIAAIDALASVPGNCNAGKFPQGLTLWPAARYTEIVTPDATSCGSGTDAQYLVQIDVAGDTWLAVQAAAAAIRVAVDAIAGYENRCVSDIDAPYDDVMKKHRRILQFEIWDVA